MGFSRISASILWPLAVAAVGCSPSEPGKPPRAPTVGAPAVPWRDKTHDEKRAFMAAYVEPTMRRKFQGFEPKDWGNFGCATCHGADMDFVDFHMPNSIYTLEAKDTVNEAMSYDAKTTKFMVEQVVPTLAMLLSEPSGQPGDTGKVTCFTCHPHE